MKGGGEGEGRRGGGGEGSERQSKRVTYQVV